MSSSFIGRRLTLTVSVIHLSFTLMWIVILISFLRVVLQHCPVNRLGSSPEVPRGLVRDTHPTIGLIASDTRMRPIGRKLIFSSVNDNRRGGGHPG